MSFNFTVKEFILGNGTGTPSLQFYRKGFELSSGGTPSYQDIVLSGVGALTLSNALADGLNYLKLFGQCEQRNLPEGYDELDGIELADGAYFDTLYKPQVGCNIEFKFATKTVGSAGCSYLGARSNDVGSGVNTGRDGAKKIVADYFGTSISNRFTSTSAFEDNTEYKVVYKNNTYYLYKNGTLFVQNTFTPVEQTQTNTLLINALHYGSNQITGNTENLIIRGLKVWDSNGILQVDAIPSKDSSQFGMYDKVTKGYLTKSDSGTFTAGNVVVPSPSTPIDIVCNNGVLKARHQSGLPLGYVLLDGITGDGTAYIDLDTTLDQNDDIEIEFLSPTAQTNRSIFGSRLSATSQNILLFYGGNTNQIVADFNNSNYAPYRLGSLAISANVKYKAILNKNIRAIYQGSTLVDSNNTVCPDTISINSAYLFYASGTPSASDKYTGTIYSVKIAGKRVLVPCKNANNEVGMYDFVSGRFFGNVAGSGAFIAGNVVSDAVEIYTDGTVEKIAVKGPNIFDNANTSLDVGQYLHVDTHDVRNGTNELSVIYQLVPGKTYTLTRLATGASIKMRLGFFDTATPAVGSVASDYMFDNNFNTTSMTFTVPAGKPYMFATLANSTNSGRTITEQQCLDAIRIMETVSSATAEMLLKVGDYKDVQSILDGQITRKVGVKVLDGTEDWIKGVVSFATQGLITNFETSNNWSPLCTHGVGINGSVTPQANSNQVRCNYTNFVYTLNLSPNFTTYPDTTAWKAFLADQYANGTPVIVVYPLATATTESVTPQSLTTQAGTNIVEITQASIDNLPLEVSYKATV